MILLDSNILIHGNQESSPHFTNITTQLIEFAEKGEELIVCPQCLYEFHVVATRPAQARGGLGISHAEALELMSKFQTVYRFINDPVELFENWMELQKKYKAVGKAAHDTRLVAFMLAHKIEKLFTMNPAHFIRYNEIITVLN